MVLLCSACAGEALVVGEERPDPGAGGREPGTSDVTGSAGPDGVALLEQCPTSPGQRQELLGCWPTRHVGRWVGFFIGAARHETRDGLLEEFPTGKLQLVIGDDGAGELAFGLVAGVEAVAPCDDLGTHSGCSPPGRLLPRFSYRLTGVELFDPEDDPHVDIAGELPVQRAERMQFVVALGQPWDTWCADQAVPKGGCSEGACTEPPTPPVAPTAPDRGAVDGPQPRLGCQCDAEGCRPDAPQLFFELYMSDDREALRGTYRPKDPSVGTATLELARE